jgi:hypothetical protein
MQPGSFFEGCHAADRSLRSHCFGKDVQELEGQAAASARLKREVVLMRMGMA